MSSPCSATIGCGLKSNACEVWRLFQRHWSRTEGFPSLGALKHAYRALGVHSPCRKRVASGWSSARGSRTFSSCAVRACALTTAETSCTFVCQTQLISAHSAQRSYQPAEHVQSHRRVSRTQRPNICGCGLECKGWSARPEVQRAYFTVILRAKNVWFAALLIRAFAPILARAIASPTLV